MSKFSFILEINEYHISHHCLHVFYRIIVLGLQENLRESYQVRQFSSICLWKIDLKILWNHTVPSNFQELSRIFKFGMVNVTTSYSPNFEFPKRRYFFVCYNNQVLLGVISRCNPLSCTLQKSPSSHFQLSQEENISGHSFQRMAYRFVLKTARVFSVPAGRIERE